jgi:hypothetical protein
MKSVVGGAIAALCLAGTVLHGGAAACTATGYSGLTAAIVNPASPVTGTVNATGCHMGVYFDASGAGGAVVDADVFGATHFGVFVNGDAGAVRVDVLDSRIHDIGAVPHNGVQQGVGVYYRGFFPASNVTGRIAGNDIFAYQKGGIVANGTGTSVLVFDNTVTGDGHVTFIAQNGIQVGFGATASVMRNRVSGNSYYGAGGWSSGGILVVGGAGYGTCPAGNPCPYTVGTRVNDNELAGNDVGIYLTNLAADSSAPLVATNVKAVNNTIFGDACFNSSYQAAISDVGNNDKMINNRISGPGYVGCYTLYNPTGALVDADASFTNRPKVHATKD